MCRLIITIDGLSLEKRILILIFVSLLSACGASSSSEPNHFESFDLSPYAMASDALSSNKLTGRWVGVLNYQYKRYNPVNTTLFRPEERESQLRSVIVRIKSGSSSQFEAASCGGGFGDITIYESDIVSGIFDGELTGPNRIVTAASITHTVKLSAYASYQEDVTVSGGFRRVSDSTAGYGSLSMNWSDTEGESVSDVYCSIIANFEGGQQTVLVGSDDGSSWMISTKTNPDSYDAYVSQPATDKKIENITTTGEQWFRFVEQTAERQQLTYSVSDTHGLTVTGLLETTLLP
tara:strand:- start:132 stop:1007 length:876 start_codon:yes stop_codon:yes gene_type:complete